METTGLTEAQRQIAFQSANNGVYRMYEDYINHKQAELIFDYIYKQQFDGQLYFEDAFDEIVMFMERFVIPFIKAAPDQKGSDPVLDEPYQQKTYHPALKDYDPETATYERYFGTEQPDPVYATRVYATRKD